MELGIKGRRAIVNGASAGMGRAAAMALAAEGVHLVISARGAARLHETAHEITSRYGVHVTPIATDHGAAEGRERILDACPAPDILVGTCSPPPMTPDYRLITDEQWAASLDTGLMSPVRFMHAVLEGMVERRWGRIVNIASIAAKYPLELRILSGAPRAGLVNYSTAVARRVAPANVTINTVLPGMFHTAAVKDQFDERARQLGTTYEQEVEKFVAAYQIPAGGFGDPEDVGAMVVLLCSERASYITGQAIVMDGGATRSTF